MEGTVIRDRVIEIFKNSIEDNIEVDFTQKMRETGINSISFIKNIVAIEDEYGIEIDDDLLSIDKFKSVDEFIDKISKFIVQNKNSSAL